MRGDHGTHHAFAGFIRRYVLRSSEVSEKHQMITSITNLVKVCVPPQHGANVLSVTCRFKLSQPVASGAVSPGSRVPDVPVQRSQLLWLVLWATPHLHTFTRVQVVQLDTGGVERNAGIESR